MTRPIYDGRISLGNIITVVFGVVAGFWWLADVDKKNALQDAQIEANRSVIKELVAAEALARKEADQELRIRIEADRAEMRQQFDKLNANMDAKMDRMDKKIEALLKVQAGKE